MKIMVTGANGFLGKALVNTLRECGYTDLFTPSSQELNLVTQVGKLREVMFSQAPEVCIHLAAKVGGIGANMANPGLFFYENMMMGLNLIETARDFGVKKFIQVGTVCAYPKYTPVPFKEEDLWNGYPEETNAPYGIAKKALLTMLQAYRQQYGFNGIYLLPVNLYGPHDNFNPATSHVIPALIRKVAHAKKHNEQFIEVWGDGSASREFLYVTECARAIVLAMEYYNGPEPINIGSGEEVSIFNLVNKITYLFDYHGNVQWNNNKPNGQPRRCLDISRAADKLHFANTVDLMTGLRKTIDFFVQNYTE